MFAIGLFFARRQKTSEDFFLAGRRMPWLPVALSMYASLTSATTYLVLPAMAYSAGTVLIVAGGISVVVAPLLIFFFYPAYRRAGVTTSYEWIGLQHGPYARMAVAALFVLARIGWLGAVIYAPALVMHTATGIPLPWGIAIMGLLATAYTALGGLRAVLWTDVVQFVILVGGALWMGFILTRTAPGGAAGILRLASETGRLPHGDWGWTLTRMTLPLVSLHFFLQMLQDYGTDQVTVQRLMSVRDNRGVMKAICFNAGSDFVLVALLLFLGLGIFAIVTADPSMAPAEGLPKDALLPHYILRALPDGISGLMLTAIFAAAMSSMDSGIHSISTVITTDWIRVLRRRKARSDSQEVTLARGLVLLFGLLATGAAFLVAQIGSILEGFATFMSLFSAPVLALFTLTLASKRIRFSAWAAATLFTIPEVFLLQKAEFSFGKLNWTAYFPISFFLCCLLTIAISYILPRRTRASPDPA
ncbi:MAG: sodium/solute symporter [Kiritimatiellia bacterium]|nr:sodium/solute symporter [Kiritimatiellia bacterium]